MTLEERIEAAEGPSRDLDVEIAKAVGAKHGAIESVDLEARSVYYIDECALSYTASIDAAMTLVPEGWEWCMFSRNNDEEGSKPSAELAPTTEVWKNGKSAQIAFAATPALALCAAALRARKERGDA